MEPYTGYVVAGYVLTALALGGYSLRLRARSRAARRRTEAVAARRRRTDERQTDLVRSDDVRLPGPAPD